MTEHFARRIENAADRGADVGSLHRAPSGGRLELMTDLE